MKKTGFIALLLTLFIAIPMKGQIRGNSINVEVIPDHQDWRYEVGETAIFNIKVTREHTLLNNVTVDYAAGPEMYQDVKKEGVVLKDGTLTLKGKMTKPGRVLAARPSRRNACNRLPSCLRTSANIGRTPSARLAK